jgi:hypothetical protein
MAPLAAVPKASSATRYLENVRVVTNAAIFVIWERGIA